MTRPSPRSLAFALLSLAVLAFLWWQLRSRAAPEPSSRAVHSDSRPSSRERASVAETAGPPAEFVGSQTCRPCHEPAYAAWKTSHHARSMAEAKGDVVLGQPAQSPAENHEPAYAVRREGERLIVRTEGPEGPLQDYPVAYTFGFTPLQQYLVLTERGRLQPLRLSWDSRSRGQGGERWFHLYSKTHIPLGDPLHFLGPNQNYQGMCGECHSTGYLRGYDEKTDSFDTHYDEIHVACESCHGPGSKHLSWAEQGREDPKRGLTHALRGSSHRPFVFTADQPTARPASEASSAASNEVDTCAFCHARRLSLDENPWPGAPLLDRALPAFPVPPLYHADGRMLDEVYNYGSFLQSKMSRQGVTCGHCHEPHSGARRAEGAAVCSSCHQPSHYAAREHTRHELGQASCIDCHMPARVYMEVDPRHDHSFRVPRPDLALLEQGPEQAQSVCRDCHDSRSAQWASDSFRRLWPEAQRVSTDELRVRARRGEPEVFEPLLRSARDPREPVLVRAACLLEAAELPGDPARLRAAALDLLRSPEDLLRLAVVQIAQHLEPEIALHIWSTGLKDARLAVRFASTQQILLGLTPEERQPLDALLTRTVREYKEKSAAFLDRAEVRTTRGIFSLSRGEWQEAEREFEAALRLSPHAVPALVNWAELDRQRGQDERSLKRIEESLRALPDAAPLHYTRGMILVRLQRKKEALSALTTAARLAPDQLDYQIAHIVSQRESGERNSALASTERALARHPHHPELQALKRRLSAH